MKETTCDEKVQQINVGNQTVHVNAEIRCLLFVVMSSVFTDGVIGSDLGGNVE